MRKLILKIWLFAILVCGLNNVLFSFFKLPYLWGIDYEKQSWIETNGQYYNTIFLGPSTTHFQIDVQSFDSINNQKHMSTNSMNFGIDGSRPVEELFILKEILKAHRQNLKYVIIELASNDNFSFRNVDNIRWKSFYSIEQFMCELPVDLMGNDNLIMKSRSAVFDFVRLVESELHAGLFSQAIDFIKSKKDKGSLVVANSGFLAVDLDSLNLPKNKWQLLERNYFLLNQIGELKRREDFARKIGKDMWLDSTLDLQKENNKGYFQVVNSMLVMAKSANIKIIFIVPPRLSSAQNMDIINVYYSLPKDCRIELAGANEYPQFYDLKYSFDLYHMDKRGAKIYTEELANRFQKLNQAQ